ncbi:hypothetical protein D3C83_204360 [compost metagenome]
MATAFFAVISATRIRAFIQLWTAALPLFWSSSRPDMVTLTLNCFQSKLAEVRTSDELTSNSS